MIMCEGEVEKVCLGVAGEHDNTIYVDIVAYWLATVRHCGLVYE